MANMLSFYNSVRVVAVLILVFILSTHIKPESARGADILRYDISDVVETLVDELAKGSRQGQVILESLSPETKLAVDGLSSGEDFRYTTFSARTQITSLYNMAERSASGEGERFIAKLHKKMSPNSGAVQLDENLQKISRQFSTADLARPLNFVDPKTMAKTEMLRPLPANVEAAVDLLARSMAPNDLGTIVTKINRHFNLRIGGKPAERAINEAIATSSNRREALRQMINANSPPPKTQEAMRRLLLDVATNHAALGMEQELSLTLKALAEEPLPSDLRSFSEVGDSLPSREAQKNVSNGADAISRAPDDTTTKRRMSDAISAGGVEALPNNGGGGPSYDSNRRAHADYGRRTHSGPEGVSRTFSRAIRSSRAARGIAIGAAVQGPAERPVAAFWIPNREDENFGRLAVSLPREQKLAVTRFLFADSFEAAISTLWGNHGSEAEFKEGEITIVMSMDPESPVAADDRRRVVSSIERKMRELRRKAIAADESERFSLLLELVELQTSAQAQLNDLPRGIVIHPALHGRELAWSAARVDFWFNNLEGLSEEAKLINGSGIPENLADVFSGRAGTWQFYQRDSRISVKPTSSGTVDRLIVESPDAGHFAVSLFAFGDERPSSAAERDEDGVWRLLNEQEAVQPLLDWALTKHHDFRRLNDYSEAISILRWLRRSNTEVIVLDADGEAQRIATPDRVFVGKVGPQAGD